MENFAGGGRGEGGGREIMEDAQIGAISLC